MLGSKIRVTLLGLMVLWWWDRLWLRLHMLKVDHGGTIEIILKKLRKNSWKAPRKTFKAKEANRFSPAISVKKH